MKPRLLDLFSGAGGAAKGYQRAGFYVVGVDVKPQPNYCGDEFIQGDALEVAAELSAGATHFIDRRRFTIEISADAIHASPPCQAFSVATLFHGRTEKHVDLVDPTRQLLMASGLPWVMENVAGSPLFKHLLMCGEMFGLQVHRHRYFETGGFFAMQSPHSRHRLKGAATNTETREGYSRGVYGHMSDWRGAARAMEVEWMGTMDEVAQAIPPAYTEHIGGYLMAAVTARAAA